MHFAIEPLHRVSLCVVSIVRQLLEGMGKTLFFRSGDTPLVLSHAQVESRKRGGKSLMMRKLT